MTYVVRYPEVEVRAVRAGDQDLVTLGRPGGGWLAVTIPLEVFYMLYKFADEPPLPRPTPAAEEPTPAPARYMSLVDLVVAAVAEAPRTTAQVRRYVMDARAGATSGGISSALYQAQARGLIEKRRDHNLAMDVWCRRED